MTDDRARRIRDLRNRRSADANGETDEDGDSSDTTAETSSSDDETSDESPETADAGNAAADGNGESSESTDEDATDSGAVDSVASGNDEPARVDEPPTNETPAETETTPAETTSAGSETDLAETTPAEAETKSAATDGAQQRDVSTAEELSYDEASIPAAETTEPATGTNEPAPMVDAQQQSATSAFGGAIADSSMLSEFVDDVGTETTADASVTGADAEGAGAAARGAGVLEQGDTLVASTHDDDDTIQMLEFHLNDNRYAVEIERISAIVEMKEITRFPRGPEAIDGVTDLRGEITAVLDPTAMLDVDRNELSDNQYIVVLERDDDKQKLGVRVTDVTQAVTYRTSQIDETASVMDSAEEHEFINGIIKKPTDGRTELVTWLDTDELIEKTD